MHSGGGGAPGAAVGAGEACFEVFGGGSSGDAPEAAVGATAGESDAFDASAGATGVSGRAPEAAVGAAAGATGCAPEEAVGAAARWRRFFAGGLASDTSPFALFRRAIVHSPCL